MKKTFGATFRFLGILAGGMSLFILARTAFEFGLSEAFGTVVGYYQAFVYPVVGLLERPFAWLADVLGWSLPWWWREAVVLYALGMGANVRVSTSDSGDLSLSDYVIFIGLSPVWPLMLPILTFLVWGGQKLDRLKDSYKRMRSAGEYLALMARGFRLVAIEALRSIIAFLVFLVLNAVL